MIAVAIPGFDGLRLEHLVLDFNGTLAFDGKLLDGVAQRVRALAENLSITVITADTFGHAADELHGLPVTFHLLEDGRQDEAKRDFILSVGAANAIAIGNGNNDALMLQAARIGIALLQEEGLSVACMTKADIVSRDILSALDLFLNPKRLIATLRT